MPRPKVPRRPSLSLLESLDPEVRIIGPGTVLWRVYFRGGHHPSNWGEFRTVGPVDARFDHHLGAERTAQNRGVLYAAIDSVTCFAEAFQQRRVINRWDRQPWLAGFEIAVPVPLLDLTGAFPTRAGASMGLMTGPRSVSREWARAFYVSYPQTCGLHYPSPMYANKPAAVLTDRAQALDALPPQPSFHRALGDPAILDFLKNAARTLGFALV